MQSKPTPIRAILLIYVYICICTYQYAIIIYLYKQTQRPVANDIDWCMLQCIMLQDIKQLHIFT